MNKQEIIIKRLDERYVGLSGELRYLRAIQFPVESVKLMMDDYAAQENEKLKQEVERLREGLLSFKWILDEIQKRGYRNDFSKQYEKIEQALIPIQ